MGTNASGTRGVRVVCLAIIGCLNFSTSRLGVFVFLLVRQIALSLPQRHEDGRAGCSEARGGGHSSNVDAYPVMMLEVSEVNVSCEALAYAG